MLKRENLQIGEVESKGEELQKRNNCRQGKKFQLEKYNLWKRGRDCR